MDIYNVVSTMKLEEEVRVEELKSFQNIDDAKKYLEKRIRKVNKQLKELTAAEFSSYITDDKMYWETEEEDTIGVKYIVEIITSKLK